MFAFWLIIVLLLLISQALLAAEQPTVSYTALSDAARKSGQLDIYKNAKLKNGHVELGDYKLTLTMPEKARAYDVIPIKYTLTQPAGTRWAAVEATAFEDPKRSGNKALYDLAVPGIMGIKIEYLGSISADYEQDKYIPLTPDAKSPISPFPPYKRDAMVCSSDIRESEIAWFKFRITNTGDTILDPEGFGASYASPVLKGLDKDGKVQWTAHTVNFFERQINYIYPGESVEQWVNFFVPEFGSHNRGLMEGSYLIDFQMLYRYHHTYEWGTNIWGGREFALLQVPIKVTQSGGSAPVDSTFTMTDKIEKMPGYLNTFEEFMTSFDVHKGAEKNTEQKKTLYLQVAPWTKNVVVKLILTDPKEIAVAKIPIKITDETLRIKYNPKNVMVLNKNGREEPVIIAQAMPAMRSGFQLGPFPEKHMADEIKEMKDLGVNVLSNTSGSWWIRELTGHKNIDLHSACYKYWYDELVRRFQMKVLGWSLYPPSSANWYNNVEPLLGRKIDYSTTSKGYSHSEHVSVDLGDPSVPEVIAAWAIYNHKRWGDYWFTAKDGRVPVEIEDTWGWLRDDTNLRYPLGPLALGKFRDWIKAKYGSITAVNKAWGSNYASFDEIDPQEDQGVEGDGLSHEPVYNKPDRVFHEWDAAIADWDTFRTELRADIYQKAVELIRKAIPNADIALRTEGANLAVAGDPKSNDMHWRHVYYAQHRNALENDVLKKTDVIKYHSDYTTMPYTDAEWRESMRKMVSEGIIPIYLPQFDHMRDILLNPYYGREYERNYNLDKPSKGMMIHCLMAAYPWWKATYEEGGAPGIIWSDYLCDGFATETQKRELRLLRDNFDKMEQDQQK
ncbi:MAG: beta-galactosidase [Armatimonadota bacterium]